MKVLVTGAKGFIGKNLIAVLKEQEDIEVLTYDIDSSKDLFLQYCKSCQFVFHLAGVNRTDNEEDFYTGNTLLTKKLIDTLIANNNTCPILYTSSVHAIVDNPYGRSKKACEELLKDYSKVQKQNTYIYRLPNLFGRWSRPNYNSVIATFCYNIANNYPIEISSKSKTINFAYIDDVIDEFLRSLQGKGTKGSDGFYIIPIVHHVSLGEIADLLYAFKGGYIPTTTKTFERKLYETYITY